MNRTRKKEIALNKDSVLSLMQEIYNELVEQRATAMRIQNKMLGLLKDAEDMTVIGPVIKEQQKVIDSALEKKIQLAKIQSSLVQKELSSNNISTSLSLEDRESLNSLLNKEKSDGDNSTEYNM